MFKCGFCGEVGNKCECEIYTKNPKREISFDEALKRVEKIMKEKDKKCKEQEKK